MATQGRGEGSLDRKQTGNEIDADAVENDALTDKDVDEEEREVVARSSGDLAEVDDEAASDDVEEVEDESEEYQMDVSSSVTGQSVSPSSFSSHLGLAFELFDRMGERNRVTWIEIIHGFARDGDMVTARRMFEEVPQEVRDVVTWTVMIDGYVENGEMEQARSVFENMPERNFYAWSVMTSSYCKIAEVWEAKLRFDRIPVKNLMNWNSMRSGYAKNGFPSEALEAFDRISKEGIKLDEIIVASALSASAQPGQLESGGRIHKLVESEGLELNQFVSNAPVDMYTNCGGLGNLSDGRMLHGFAVKRNLDGDPWVQSCLSDLHSKCKDPYPASRVFEDTNPKNIVLGSCMLSFRRMHDGGIEPDEVTIMNMLNTCKFYLNLSGKNDEELLEDEMFSNNENEAEYRRMQGMAKWNTERNEEEFADISSEPKGSPPNRPYDPGITTILEEFSDKFNESKGKFHVIRVPASINCRLLEHRREVIEGIRSDFAEIGGRFRSGISRISNNKAVWEFTKMASSLLQLWEEDEEEGVLGVSEEAVAFTRNVAMHPETWLNLPIVDGDEDDYFELSDAQYEHALAIENHAPGLAACIMELCPGYMTEGCFWKIYLVLLHIRLKKEDAALLSTQQVMELRVMLMQELQSCNTGKPKSDQSEGGSLFESGQSSHKELLFVPLSSGPISEIIETSNSGTANSDVDLVAEAEKHPVQAGEIHVGRKTVDGEKQIDVDEVKYQLPYSDSSSQVVDDKYEDDGDNWLKEDTSETAEVKVTTTINIENDEDVSFSDLEDDDGDIPATYKKGAYGSDSSTRDSRDWVQLGGSSDDSMKVS